MDAIKRSDVKSWNVAVVTWDVVSMSDGLCHVHTAEEDDGLYGIDNGLTWRKALYSYGDIGRERRPELDGHSTDIHMHQLQYVRGLSPPPPTWHLFNQHDPSNSNKFKSNLHQARSGGKCLITLVKRYGIQVLSFPEHTDWHHLGNLSISDFKKFITFDQDGIPIEA